jgi:hypothetical protein
VIVKVRQVGANAYDVEAVTFQLSGDEVKKLLLDLEKWDPRVQDDTVR